MEINSKADLELLRQSKLKKKPGPKKVYKTRAQQQAAYRARKRVIWVKQKQATPDNLHL